LTIWTASPTNTVIVVAFPCFSAIILKLYSRYPSAIKPDIHSFELRHSCPAKDSIIGFSLKEVAHSARMAFRSYFKASTTVAAEHVEAGKAGSGVVPAPLESATQFPSSRPASRHSVKSTTGVGDEARHHIMLSYIFQHQQSSLWIDDTSGEIEGAMIRKSRHNYLCSPPHLANSPLAHAMDVLNVQVGVLFRIRQEYSKY
jgi:hypothetical protein